MTLLEAASFSRVARGALAAAIVPLLTFPLATACARVGLQPGEGAAAGTGAGSAGAGGGAAGGASGGSSGFAGGGGPTTTGTAGGPTGSCDVLSVVGPPAFLGGGYGYHQRSPVWTWSNSNGSRVTLVSGWQAVEGPAGGRFPAALVHTSFEPWDTFPAGQSIGDSHQADDDGGGAAAAARAVGDRFALLYFDAAVEPSGAMVYSPEYEPDSSALPPLYPVDDSSKEPVFAVPGQTRHLLAMQRFGPNDSGTKDAYRMRVVEADPTGISPPVDLGCADAPMRADAVRDNGDTFIMAMSNGGAFLNPGCSSSEFDSPDEVQIAFIFSGNTQYKDSFDAPNGAVDLKMVHTAAGMVVVVGTIAGQVPKVHYQGARIDDTGHVDFMFPVTYEGSSQELPVAGTLAAAHLGNGFAVAFVDVAGDEGPFLRVKAFDEDTSPLGHVEVYPATSIVGRPSLIGSPLPGSLLLAWSETSDGSSGGGDEMRVVRIDCIGP